MASETVFDAGLSSPGLTISADTATITTAGGYASGLSHLSASTGRVYFEVRVTAPGDAHALSLGLSTPAVQLANIAGNDAVSFGYSNYDGLFRFNGQGSPGNLGTPAVGAVFGVAVDFTAHNAWIVGPTGLWNGQPASTDNPVTGLGGLNDAAQFNGALTALLSGTLYVDVSVYSNSKATLNIGQSAFALAVPAGFGSWDGSAAAVDTPTPTQTPTATVNRFCRLLFGPVNSGGNATAVQFITLAAANGVNLAISAAAISGDPNTEIAASNAVVGQPGEWASTLTTGAYLIYDFGAGNGYDIQTIGLTACDFTAGFPTSVQAQSSGTNNGTDWATDWSIAIPPNPTAQQVFSFTNPAAVSTPTPTLPVTPTPPATPLAAGAHRFWRIYVRNTGVGTGAVGVACIRLHTLDGVNQATVAANATSSTVDNNTPPGDAVVVPGRSIGVALAWAFAGPIPGWWEFDFGAGNGFAITSISFNSRYDQYFAQAPTDFDVQFGDAVGGPRTTAWSVDGLPAAARSGIITISHNPAVYTLANILPASSLPGAVVVGVEGFGTYIQNLGAGGEVSTHGAAGLFGSTNGFLNWSSPAATKPDGSSGWNAELGPTGGMHVASDPVTLTLGESLTQGTLGFRVKELAGVGAVGPLTIQLVDPYGVVFLATTVDVTGAVGFSVPRAFDLDVGQFDASATGAVVAGRFAAVGLYLEIVWSLTADGTAHGQLFVDNGVTITEQGQVFPTSISQTTPALVIPGMFGTALSLGSVVFAGPVTSTAGQQTYAVSDLYVMANRPDVFVPTYVTGAVPLGDVQVIQHLLTPPAIASPQATTGTTLAVAGPAPVPATHTYLATRIQATYAQTGTGAAVIQSLVDADGNTVGGPARTLPAAGSSTNLVDVTSDTDHPGVRACTDVALAAGDIKASIELQELASGSVAIMGLSFTTLARVGPLAAVSPAPPPARQRPMMLVVS